MLYSARAMPHSRPTVGIRLPVWAGATTPVMGEGARYMHNHGHWHIETPNDSYGEMKKVEITVGWQGDGLILYRATEKELADFKNRGIAVVLLSTEGPDAGYPRVLPDNGAMGRAAATHLMEHGHDSYAYLARGDTLYKGAIGAVTVGLDATNPNTDVAIPGYPSDHRAVPGTFVLPETGPSAGTLIYGR